MEIDPRGIERVPVDHMMGDPMDRHLDRHRPPHMEPIPHDAYGRNAFGPNPRGWCFSCVVRLF